MTVDIASLTDADGTVRYTVTNSAGCELANIIARPGYVGLMFIECEDATPSSVLHVNEWSAGDMRMFAHALLAAAEYAP